jgi:hypothetical protein
MTCSALERLLAASQRSSSVVGTCGIEMSQGVTKQRACGREVSEVGRSGRPAA